MRRAALLALVALVPVSAGRAETVDVVVRITDRAVTFSPESVELGPVRFVVHNAASGVRTFALAGVRTRRLARGQRQVLAVTFEQAGSYAYTVSGPGAVRRRGVFRVTEPPPPPPPPPPAVPTLTLVGQFSTPTDVDAPPHDDRRLVVVQQNGLVYVLVDGVRRDQPFLDLRDRVLARAEAGLLSIAFAPDYVESGLLYVYYNGLDGTINIAEFRRDANDPDRVDPATARILLRQPKSIPFHNGGMLQVGSDGALYASIGDDGAAALAQSPGTVFGKILKVDIATGRSQPWASGLRNPWRFWIDAVTGDAYIADVGQNRVEEIDLVPAGTSGLNFGWPCFEGTQRFDEAQACAAPTPPLYEYGHGDGRCSITGGVVARDPRFPGLFGSYLFADLCGGPVWALSRTAAGVRVVDIGVSVQQPISFGLDSLGRVYVGSLRGGVYRIDPAS